MNRLSMAVGGAAALLALLGLPALSPAQEPDFIEEFENFQTINTQNLTALTDIPGIFWQVFPQGQVPTSTNGFVSVPVGTNAGFNGKSIAWNGEERNALIQTGDIVLGGDKNHQVALALKFSNPQGTAGDDITQVFSPVPRDFNIAGVAIVEYVLAVGKTAAGETGFILYLPQDNAGAFQQIVVPAAPDIWHKVVIQYKPASNVIARDAAIRLWIDPRLGTENPDFHIESTDGLLGSPFGAGGLGRFTLGDATDITGGRSDGRAGSSTVKVDTVGGWTGLEGERAPGSLAAAVTFLDSRNNSAVADWELFDQGVTPGDSTRR